MAPWTSEVTGGEGGTAQPESRLLTGSTDPVLFVQPSSEIPTTGRRAWGQVRP